MNTWSKRGNKFDRSVEVIAPDAASRSVAAADLVLLQRLPVGQAQLAARVWRLPPPMVHELTTLADDEVVALGHMLWKRMKLITNTKEQQILGPVRRGD